MHIKPSCCKKKTVIFSHELKGWVFVTFSRLIKRPTLNRRLNNLTLEAVIQKYQTDVTK